MPAERVWALLICALQLGCGVGQSSLQQPTAKAIGCPAEDVQIAQDMGGFGGRTWIAHCNGKRYECSSRQDTPAPECALSQ